MQAGRAEIGHQLPGRHACRRDRGAALAKERALAPLLGRRKLPVHEHGQVQLPRQPVAHGERLVVGQLAVVVAQVHDRDHVEGTDARMRTLVHAHVDVLDRRPRSGHDRVGNLLRSTDERVDAAVVVVIGMHVEQGAAVRRERVPERLDAGDVPSLADVGNRLDHDLAIGHGRPSYSGCPGRNAYSSSPAAASASARLVYTCPDTTRPPSTAQIHCVGESEM